MGEAEVAVLAHMASNGGVITRAEALTMGMTGATLARRVSSGHLVTVGRGIYVLPGVIRDELTMLAAATAALNAVVSHESAARLHRLGGLDPRRISVTVPVRRSNRFLGVLVHQSTDLAEDEVLEVENLPVTDVPRTINDLAAVLPEKLLAQVLDQAVRRGFTTYPVVALRLESTARKGKPGVAKLRRVLATRLDGHFVTDSVMETRALKVIEDAGLPLPSTQYRPPWLRKVNGRVDLAYVDEEVIVECDSLMFHGTPEAFQLDRYRDNLAWTAGWIPLRFTWDDITKRPYYVVDIIRTALMKRSKSQ